jgi:hypothetical protein
VGIHFILKSPQKLDVVYHTPVKNCEIEILRMGRKKLKMKKHAHEKKSFSQTSKPDQEQACSSLLHACLTLNFPSTKIWHKKIRNAQTT